jgi:hypothetical protein
MITIFVLTSWEVSSESFETCVLNATILKMTSMAENLLYFID